MSEFKTELAFAGKEIKVLLRRIILPETKTKLPPTLSGIPWFWHRIDGLCDFQDTWFSYRLILSHWWSACLALKQRI
jgi:hypothetical protein